MQFSCCQFGVYFVFLGKTYTMDTKDIAAFNLVGQTLNATWVVKQRIDKEPSGTGGFFSVCYLVEDRLHNNFFLKAFNNSSLNFPGPKRPWQ